MTMNRRCWYALVGIVAIGFGGGTAAFARGGGRGGGGYRGGGGSFSRPSYSGSGSIRYSSPSRSAARPSTPSYSRPATPSYRPSTPAPSQRPAGGYSGGGATPSYRPSTPAPSQRPVSGSSVGGSYNRPTTPAYRPAGGGSIVNGGSITTPGGATISGIRGPGGGGAVSIKGPDGGTAGAIKGPGGGGAAGIKGPDGGAAGAIRGPGGGGAAGVRGPGGGAAGVVRGPGGGAAAGVVGPGGGAAGVVRGPGGGGAVGIRGPNGGAAGAVWGPGGRGVAGVRGPYGNRFITTLPAGAIHYPWHGHDYWHVGFGWWRPCWVDDDVSYIWAYPPVGYYYPALPPNYNTVVINNTTYYESENVYYQPGEQGGQKGYVVAEAPATPEETTEAAGENPFKVFKSMCDYIAGLESFGVLAYTTTDRVRESGEKVQISARRILSVSRPNKFAVDVRADTGTKLCVYDGKTVSLFDRNKNVYTVVEVPDTIDAALDVLVRDYKLVVPLEDLMYKDLYARVEAIATAGQYLGRHKVDDIDCHHLAFATESSSWEIWIDAGAKPVPRKITIDYRDDAVKPRYTAEIRGWTTGALSPTAFDFKLPEGVKRIEMAPQGKEGSR